MKSLLLIFLTTLATITMHAQDIEGTYSNKWVSKTGEGIEYVLTLNEDGNFLFNYTRMYRNADETNIEVQGTWSLENHLLVLNADDDSEKENMIAAGLDLNKARFVSVSPRNPKFNLVKPSLKFYESEVFYAKDMELIKTEVTVTSRD